jgi:hypothetical protein
MKVGALFYAVLATAYLIAKSRARDIENCRSFINVGDLVIF